MSASRPGQETLHAGCVSIGGRGVLIRGASGSGKSDLALRLIDRGAALVSDDYTIVTRRGPAVFASAPPSIAGKLEVRGVGIIDLDEQRDVPISLLVDLDLPSERLPDGPGTTAVAGVELPSLGLAALEASSPIKLEAALNRFGLPLP